MSTATWQQRWQQVMLNNYGTPALAVVAYVSQNTANAIGTE